MTLPPPLRKGLRTIDIQLTNEGFFGGLGVDLLSQDRNELLNAFGIVEYEHVKGILDGLGIGADINDFKSLQHDLESMRITEHRLPSDLDEIMALAEKVATKLPVGTMAQPPAVRELGESYTSRMSPAGLLRIDALGHALRDFALAADAVCKLRIWEMTKQDWPDDALCLAAALDNIARRSRASKMPSFRSSTGPANRAVAELLNLAGIRVRGQPVKADAVRSALREHPQAVVLDLA